MNKFLFLLTILHAFTFAMYKQGCYQGYYQADGCTPCHPSCKTCSGPYSCDTCEDYMFLQHEVTHVEGYHPEGVQGKLCDKCPEGQYYDQTGKTCRSCNASCDFGCGYQSLCFQCGLEEVYDLVDKKCINKEECVSPKHLLSSSQYTLGTICRTLDYYVDPFSTKNIELGTLEFPYRAFKSLSSELLNINSHSTHTITIYTNDAYLEDGDLMMVNISQVILKPLPDYIQILHKGLFKKSKYKPLIIPTHYEQHGISERAFFHILKHSLLDSDKVLEDGEFTTYETNAFSAEIATIRHLRTSLEIDGINFYREEIDYNEPNLLIAPIYLQDRLLKITNCDFNVTGEVVVTNDPYNVHLENIVVEGYSLRNFVTDRPSICNYPEAFLRANFYARNITYVSYRDRTTSRSAMLLISSGPSNVTFEDIDVGNFYVHPSDRLYACSITIDSFCIPEDDDVQITNFHGFKSQLDNLDNPDDKYILNAMMSFRPHYRSLIGNYSNFEFKKFHNNFGGPLIGVLASPLDEFHLSNLHVSNSTSVNRLFDLYYVRSLSMTNLVFQGMPEMVRLMNINLCVKVLISNVTITNYTTEGNRSYNDISINSLETTEVTIDGLYLLNSKFLGLPFLDILTQPKELVIKNSYYRDVIMDGSISFFNLRSISSTSISNQTLSNVTIEAESGAMNHLVEFKQLDLLSEAEITINDIVFDNSDISFVKFNTVSSQTTGKNLIIKNIQLKNTYYKGTRSIISTQGFEVAGDVQLVFESLLVKNISFPASGEIMILNQYLENPVIIRNSAFEDISSGIIQIDVIAKTNSGLESSVKIENCSFTRIANTFKPFIDSSQNGNFEIMLSNFSQITSVSESFGFIHLSENSAGTFTNCIFTNNSALTATIFKVESKSILRCYQCEIYSNFALKYGVFEVASSESISFTNSSLYDNYAIQNSIGSILETVDSSEFTNCIIYNNLHISEQEVLQEVEGNCDLLCMMSQNFKDYLSQNLYKITHTEASIYAISVITGAIELRQGTQVYEQPYLMNCFLSDVKMTNMSLQSIVFEQTYIKAASSDIKIQDVSLDLISQVDKGIFLGISQSTISIQNVNYSESNAVLLLSASSKVYIQNLAFQTIVGVDTLLDIIRSPESHFNGIKITNCSVLTHKMIDIHKSSNLKILNMSLSSQNKTLFGIEDSDIEAITDLHVSNYSRAISAKNSNIRMIANSSFTSCGSQDLTYAGAVHISESNATFDNVTFSDNKAITGGAIALMCSDAENCHVTIQKCEFKFNSAVDKGGAIYYNYRPPTLDQSTQFISNTAQYGANLASYPVMVGVLDNSTQADIIIDQVSSGIKIDQKIKLALYDGNHQVMVADDSSQISIVSDSQKYSMKGFNVQRITDGVAEFNDLIPVAEPGSLLKKYHILSKSIDKTKVQNAFRGSIIQPGIIINFSYCKPGEQVIKGQCYECPAGTYSFEWNSTQCHQCEENADCMGKTEMKIAKGYWRSSTNSTKIVECVRKETCEGGYYPENKHPVQCKDGYNGKLCSKCKISEETKYQKVDDFECQICPDPVINALRVIALVILVFIFLMVIIITNIKKTSESEFSVLLRILTNYLHIITTSMSMTTKYPSSLTNIFLPLNKIGNSSQTFLSFDCFILDSEIKGPFGSNSILKLFLILILPLILFLIVSLIWICVRLINKNWVQNMRRNLIISFISILFMLHPKLTESGVNAFRCVNIDDTTRAMRIDTDIECYSTVHIKWCLLIAVPILVIWVVALPVIGLVILYKARKSGNQKILGYFLILYQGLKNKTFYWEFVNTLRKLLIVISFLFPNNFKIGFSILVMVASQRLEEKFKPYKLVYSNNLAQLSTAAGIVTLNASYVFEQDENISHLNLLILILIVYINTKFALEWIWLCLKYSQDKFEVIKYAYLLTSKLLCKKKSVAPSPAPKSPKEKAPSLPLPVSSFHPSRKNKGVVKRKKRSKAGGSYINHKKRITGKKGRRTKRFQQDEYLKTKQKLSQFRNPSGLKRIVKEFVQETSDQDLYEKTEMKLLSSIDRNSNGSFQILTRAKHHSDKLDSEFDDNEHFHSHMFEENKNPYK